MQESKQFTLVIAQSLSISTQKTWYCQQDYIIVDILYEMVQQTKVCSEIPFHKLIVTISLEQVQRVWKGHKVFSLLSCHSFFTSNLAFLLIWNKALLIPCSCLSKITCQSLRRWSLRNMSQETECPPATSYCLQCNWNCIIQIIQSSSKVITYKSGSIGMGLKTLFLHCCQVLCNYLHVSLDRGF